VEDFCALKESNKTQGTHIGSQNPHLEEMVLNRGELLWINFPWRVKNCVGSNLLRKALGPVEASSLRATKYEGKVIVFSRRM